jgi:Xaa-Pro aminopeptidase
MQLEAIQAALQEAGADGWLFYDFHHRDPMAYKILGLDMSSMTTRRWFYYIPASGEPVKLSHRVEPTKLESLPGKQEYYSAWRELHNLLRESLGSPGKIAMQYSPMNNIPYVSVVDAGTVELVRSFGHEVTTSADLVQAFESVSGEEGFLSHAWAGERVQKIKDEVFALMDDNLRHGRKVTEFEIKEHILARFEQEGMTSDGDSPIVGFNDHPADPHFEPTADNAYTLHHGDTILVDLWARRTEPPGIYYDITWCGFAGQEPPSLYTDIFGVVCKARDAAVDFIREKVAAGTPCYGWEVDDACRRVVDQAGFGQHFVHRTGHSIGFEVHGNGVNIDNLETKDERLLIPGICFSIEPGIYLQGQMAVRSELNVYITPSGSVEVIGSVQESLLFVG